MWLNGRKDDFSKSTTLLIKHKETFRFLNLTFSIKTNLNSFEHNTKKISVFRSIFVSLFFCSYHFLMQGIFICVCMCVCVCVCVLLVDGRKFIHFGPTPGKKKLIFLTQFNISWPYPNRAGFQTRNLIIWTSQLRSSF